MHYCLMLDVDGVLISGRPFDGKKWTSSLLDDLGIDPQTLFDQFFDKQWEDVVTGKRDLLSALAEGLKLIPTNVTPRELISYWFEMDSRIVKPVLEDCRIVRANGVRVFLTTNQEHERAKYVMETIGLQSEVDGIIYSAQAGTRKPHSGFYAFAAKATGCHPNQLILVDDTKENVEGARNAGWKAVHWQKRFQLIKALESITDN